MENIKNTELKDDWKLKKIELEFQSYGENKGKYVGKVMFCNGEFESFQFKIRPNMAEGYIKLISKYIVESTESLGSRLIDSLGLKKN